MSFHHLLCLGLQRYHWILKAHRAWRRPRENHRQIWNAIGKSASWSRTSADTSAALGRLAAHISVSHLVTVPLFESVRYEVFEVIPHYSLRTKDGAPPKSWTLHSNQPPKPIHIAFSRILRSAWFQLSLDWICKSEVWHRQSALGFGHRQRIWQRGVAAQVQRPELSGNKGSAG